ncbi:hypothetical protein BJV78DRAFT_353123 [Lactifluus subvellereus]|nr:hypothetical protein BJV78DRAFT_353123 [Lactifluus subvellereus]
MLHHSRPLLVTMPNRDLSMDPVVPPLAAHICETFFFGVYSALFAFSTFFMLCKGLSSRTRNAMLVVSVVMYAVSASHWALSTSIVARGSRALALSEELVLLYVPVVNLVLSDSIVLWRAWVLWNRRFILFVPPLIFILCTLAISIASAVFIYEGSRTNSVRKTDMSRILRWSICALTIGTNLWATCLIFIRTWQQRRFLRRRFGDENATGKAESALGFLVESGAFYLCIWLTFVTVATVGLPTNMVLIFRISIVQIVGIYPTAIFVVVTMRLSAADILSHPGPEKHHHPSTMILAHPSSTTQHSILAMTAGSPSDSSFFVRSGEDRRTRTLASSGPQKEEKIVRTRHVT